MQTPIKPYTLTCSECGATWTIATQEESDGNQLRHRPDLCRDCGLRAARARGEARGRIYAQDSNANNGR